MPLAIEPLHPMYAADRACVNTLGQALDICEALDPAERGWASSVDVYHVWWDPDVLAGITRAGEQSVSTPSHLGLARADAATCCSTAA